MAAIASSIVVACKKISKRTFLRVHDLMALRIIVSIVITTIVTALPATVSLTVNKNV